MGRERGDGSWMGCGEWNCEMLVVDGKEGMREREEGGVTENESNESTHEVEDGGDERLEEPEHGLEG